MRRSRLQCRRGIETERIMDVVERYLRELQTIRSGSAGTEELANYQPLLNLLNEVGRSLKPRVNTIGGYQVIKKWLSYREKRVLGRDLRLAEVQHVTDVARRLAAIVLLQPRLDGNYQAVKGGVYGWG